jgi:hypothetical protein
MNSATHSEGASRSSRSHRFTRKSAPPAFWPRHSHHDESPLRGVRTLSSVLQQVLLEIEKGGKP